MSLSIYIAGDSLGYRLVFNPLQIRKLQRSLMSTAYLMPSQDFWSNKEVLVYRPKRNYTAFEYKEFFEDIGFPDGYLMWEDTRDLTKVREIILVELWYDAMVFDVKMCSGI